jgi:Mg2+ and Co2+ transporter CorA
MKSLFVVIIFALVACGKTSDKGHQHHDDNDSAALTANRALYDQAREIHDEVMPKVEDIYNLKKGLKEKIARTPDMAAEKKKELENAIAKLDSASNAMMDWMHEFRPLPDSADQEKAREYLETEIEHIKKVRDMMNESLNKAKSLAGSE